MAMMTGPNPVQPPAPAPQPAPPSAHQPLIQRVEQIERDLAAFIKNHQQFIVDVVRELGL